MRSAFGFLKNRLVEKLPAHPEETADLLVAAESAPPPPLPAITCDGPGEERLFRPHESWVTTCGPCHREQQRAYWADALARAEADPAPSRPPWRELVAAEARAGALRGLPVTGPGPRPRRCR